MWKISKKKYFIAGLAGLVVLIFLYFVFFGADDEQVTYLTDTARMGDIEQKVNAAGEVAPLQMVSVGAQVSGQIEKLYVSLGQQVKKGERIADIDSTTQVNELETNKAKLETYKAQLASREVALKIAQIRYNREKKLTAQDASSKESLEEAEKNLALAGAEVRETQSLIRQQQIAVNTSEVNLGYTRILSPMDGVVVSVQVEEGQTVNAGLSTPVLVQIADLSSMEIKIQISEGDVTKVRPGLTVYYSIFSEPDLVREGRIKSVDPGLTTLSNGEYEGSTDGDKAVYYYAKVIVPNEDNKLRIGMTTQNVIMINSAKGVLLVPSMALHSRNGITTATVLLPDGGVEERQVEVGLSDAMNTQILSGLQAGEQVVLTYMSAREMVDEMSKMGPGRRR